MASSITTNIVYPEADFVAATAINADILAQEIDDDGAITAVPDSVTYADGLVGIAFTELLDATQKAALDALVAAHVGGAFASVPITAFANAESSDDSGSEVSKASISTGKLPAGTYLFSWYMEIAATTVDASPVAAGRLNVAIDGGASAEQASDVTGEGDYQSFSGSLPRAVLDGQSFDLDLTFQRIGSAGNAARARRARLAVTKVD